MLSNNVRLVRAAVISSVCVGLFTGMVGSLSAQEPAAKPEPSSKKFKNIKILKDLPSDKLIPVMHDYNTALNVKCSFCHETTTGADGKRTGYEKDTNPMKNKARDMIVMMEKLNKSAKTIDKQATCFMCHHGHPEPETHAPAAP